MRWPLRNQILLPMTLLVAFTVIVVSGTVAVLLAQHTKANIEGRLSDASKVLTTSSFPLTDAVLQQTRSLSGAEFAFVNQQGATSAVSLAALRDFSLPVAESTSREVHLERILHVDGVPYFHVSATRFLPGSPHQSGTIHLLYPQRAYTQTWRDAVLPPILLGGAALLIVTLLSLVVASRVTSPLRRLRDQVANIAQGGREPMPLTRRDDEVRDLATAINQLAETLTQYEANIRASERLRTLGQLGGGIAHQLRNSATGCRMALDFHCRRCPAAADDEDLAVAVRQLELMENYLRRFLKLGQESPQPRSSTDLGALTVDAVDLVAPTARHLDVVLKFIEPPEPILIDVDPAAIEQLLVNVLLNGLEAASQRSPSDEISEKRPARVSVELATTSDARVNIRIADTGPGPDSELHATLFEPLVTQKKDGVGLGLSVARSIAQQHGGRIFWQRRDGWTVFTVDLPLLVSETTHGALVGH